MKLLELYVRLAEEFRAGHVPGTLNVRLNELEAYLDKPGVAHETVAYCRGPYCVLAFDAVVKADF